MSFPSAPLLKLPLLFAMSQGIRMGFTPPRPLPSSDERHKYDGSQSGREAVPNVGTWGPTSLRILAYVSQAWETYVICLQNMPETSRTPFMSLLRAAGVDALPAAGRLRASPMFLIGALLVGAGAYLRVVCFRRLGRHFTFQLSVQKDHDLVTDGPYAIVRHPSYAAAMIQVIGFALCLTAPGSWWLESRMWQTSVGALVTVLVGMQMTLCFAGGIDRTFKEDMVMKTTFKEKWTEWAQRTRYRLIPFVF